MSSPRHDEYHIGIICALSIELAAVRGMFDEEYGMIEDKSEQDSNVYSAGRIHNHNIIAACLPAGVVGLAAAATVATNMLHTFHAVRFGLLVGIGGGIPDVPNGIDIRLGDVVVSQPKGKFGGVVQYDKGKAKAAGQWEQGSTLNAPPTVLLTALSSLQTEHEVEESKMSLYLEQMLKRKPRMKAAGYGFPGREKDVLHAPDHNHTTAECDCPIPAQGDVVIRQARPANSPCIHYGTIASGNTVVKDALVRDRIRRRYTALCVEMEAAGLMNDFPCLIIRGVSDYADKYKNDVWHRYASASAAAFAKELLLHVSASQMRAGTTVQQLTDSLQGVTLRMDQQDALLKTERERKARNAILDWITPYTGEDRYRDKIKERHPDTGQWFLTHASFQDWEVGKLSKLTCPGVPGAGKSVMAAIVIEKLLQNRIEGQYGVAYIFCRHKLQQEQTVDNFTRVLLRQILDSGAGLPAKVEALYQAYQRERKLLDFDQLQLILTEAVRQLKRVFFVIDAFDECSEITRRMLTRMLRQLMESINVNGESKLRVMITSRPGHDLSSLGAGQRILIIRAEDADQERYLVSQFEDLSKCVAQNLDLRNRVLRQIIKATDGMFLLANLYLKSLESQRTEEDVEQKLNNIARESMNDGSQATLQYAHAYKSAIDRLEQQKPDDRVWAKRLLSWVVHAHRPLTVQEMTDALAYRDHMKNKQGLVSIGANTRTVELVHYTAQEYFAHPSYRPQWIQDALPEIVDTCLGYLSLQSRDEGSLFGKEIFKIIDRKQSIAVPLAYKRIVQELPFTAYAAQSWGFHALHIQDTLSTSLRTMLKSELFVIKIALLLQEALFVDLTSQSSFRQRLPQPWTILHLAAYFGLDTVIEDLTARSSSRLVVGEDKDSEETPIDVAILQGNSRVIEQLWTDSYHFPISYVNDKFHKWLELAVRVDQVDTVRWLVEQIPRFEGIKDAFGTSLRDASYALKEIAEILLEHDALCKTSDKGSTALHAAATLGRSEVVQLLVNHGIDVNCMNKQGSTALRAAAAYGREEVARLLLNHGAQVNVVDKQGFTALYAAASRGHKAVVWLLLRHGAEISVANSQGCTALHAAATNGNEEVVQLLLDKGARIDEADFQGRTALHCAAAEGKARIVQLLLDSGAPINADYGVQSTALHAAAANGSEEVIHLLLDRGASVGSKDKRGQSVLQAAVIARKAKAAILLLDRGAHISIADDNESLLLQAAAAHGDVHLLKSLVSHGAKLTSRIPDSDVSSYSSPLHAAAAKGRLGAINFLLDNGADAQLRDKDNYRAIDLALANHKYHVVRILCEHLGSRPAVDTLRLLWKIERTVYDPETPREIMKQVTKFSKWLSLRITQITKTMTSEDDKWQICQTLAQGHGLRPITPTLARFLCCGSWVYVQFPKVPLDTERVKAFEPVGRGMSNVRWTNFEANGVEFFRFETVDKWRMSVFGVGRSYSQAVVFGSWKYERSSEGFSAI